MDATSAEIGGGRESALDRYSTDGGKLSFHGLSYQLKLLMLFMIRGLNKNLPFRLATEMKAAEKFDDVILELSKGEKGGRQFHFLQAKHSAGEQKGSISVHNLLLDVKGDFGLQKYFQSYLKMKENPLFNEEKDEVIDLILYTNKGFKFHDRLCDFELREDIFQSEVTNGVNILDDILQTKLLRFKGDFAGKSFLVSQLKNVFVKLPKEVAENVLRGETFDLSKYNFSKNKLLESYRKALVEEVIDPATQSFRDSFIESENLSPEARHFRDVLQGEYFGRHYHTGEDFVRDLRSRKVKITTNLAGGECQIDSPGKIAEKLASLIRKNADTKSVKILDSKSVIVRNISALAGEVFIKDHEGIIKLNPNFILKDETSEIIGDFKKLMVIELKKRNIELSDVTEYVFEIVNYPESHFSLSEISFYTDTIEYFLKKLAFAVKQPNEVELDEIIKKELLKEFKTTEADNVYGRFLVKTFNWMKEKVGKYFSHEEGRVFFEQMKKEMLASVWFAVKNPTTNFTGRNKELVDLHETLKNASEDGAAAVITQSVSISGLGGVGKTELAKQYAYLHSSEYDNIIWINAESRTTISNSFRKLAFDKLGIREENVNGKVKSLETIVEEVYDFFRGKTSLFVFDNAEKMRMETDGDSGIQNFLPKFPVQSKHYTLITSRNQNWGELVKIKLETLTESEAISLIGKSIDLSKGSQSNEARELARALQCYPLALQQAIAYIKASDDEKAILGGNYTISNYLEAFKNMCIELLDFPFQNDSSDSYTKGTYTTWKITLNYIKDRKYGRLAIEVLNIIAYFAPDEISIENLLNILEGEDYSELISSLAFLKQYSMLVVENRKANVHRLVQLITRLRLKEEGKEEEILRKILRAGEKLDVDHAISVWNFSCENPVLVKDFCHIPNHISRVLLSNFKLKETCSFAEKSVKQLEKHLGENHLSALKVKLNMAHALNGLGMFVEALRNFEKVYEIIISKTGDEDPRSLEIKNYIADTMNNLGRYDEALSYYKDVFSKVCASYGEHDLDTLNLKHNMANVLCNLGEHAEALNTYEFVYEKLKTSLGECHQKTLNTKNNMANVLDKLGEHEKALKFYEEVYEKSKASLNDNHPMIMTTKHNMASVLEKLGKHEEALKLYQEVYENSLKVFGQYHPDTINTKNNISYVLFKLKEQDEALKSYQEVFEDYKIMFGINHEKTIHCKYSIAIILYNLRRKSEAVTNFSEVYESMTKCSDESKPKLLQTKQSVANFLYNLGEHDKALILYKELNEHNRLKFGDDDPKTIVTKQFLSKILYNMEKYQEAYEIYMEIYTKMFNDYGEDHDETLTAKHNVASALNKLGKHEESYEYYEDIYEKQRLKFGEFHPTTVLAKKNMASMWHKVQNRMLELPHDHKPANLQSAESSVNESFINENGTSVIVVPPPQTNRCSRCCCLKRLSWICNAR